MDCRICKYLERGKEGNPIKLENLDNLFLSLHMYINVCCVRAGIRVSCIYINIGFMSYTFSRYIMSFLSIFKYYSSI